MPSSPGASGFRLPCSSSCNTSATQSTSSSAACPLPCLALGIARTPSLANLFVLGLVAGTLSFGGAYTAIPFVQVEAVLMGAWLPQSVFIDGIAIGNILPAPLVIFATFVGFQGAYLDGSIGNAFGGAVVITLGMFFPCFVFTIAGHELLEKLVRNKVSRALTPSTPSTRLLPHHGSFCSK